MKAAPEDAAFAFRFSGVAPTTVRVCASTVMLPPAPFTAPFALRVPAPTVKAPAVARMLIVPPAPPPTAVGETSSEPIVPKFKLPVL